MCVMLPESSPHPRASAEADAHLGGGLNAGPGAPRRRRSAHAAGRRQAQRRAHPRARGSGVIPPSFQSGAFSTHTRQRASYCLSSHGGFEGIKAANQRQPRTLKPQSPGVCLSSTHTARTTPRHPPSIHTHPSHRLNPPCHTTSLRRGTRAHTYYTQHARGHLSSHTLLPPQHRWRGCRRARAWPRGRRLEAAPRPTEATCTHRTRW